MTYIIFAIVAIALFGMARLTKLTYNTVNILVYYLLIPLSWTYMSDKIIGWQMPWLTMGWTTVWLAIFIATKKRFQLWCDWAFRKSVEFLLWFKLLKWNYYVASVYICVWLPLIIYGILASLLILQHPDWDWQPWVIGIASAFAIIWILWTTIISFCVKLVPFKVLTLESNPLTYDEERQIISDTKGMNHNQVINYALNAVKKKFSDIINSTEEDKSSYVSFSAMFASVVNLGFQTNCIAAHAVTVEGTASVCGMNICKVLGRLINPMLRKHKFTLIKTAEGFLYCIDSTVNAIFGYKLKTEIKPYSF